MSTPVVVNIVLGVAVLALVLWRQLSTRSVQSDRNARVLAVLGVLGAYQLVHYVTGGGQISAAAIGCLVLSLAIGGGLAALRARTTTVWWTANGWMRRGTALTLVLWLVSIGCHFLIDFAGDRLAPDAGIGQLGNATILLYLVVVLGVQNALLTRRVAAMHREPVGV
jgi:hypothetical protein